MDHSSVGAAAAAAAAAADDDDEEEVHCQPLATDM